MATTVAIRIARERDRLGITDAELARRMNVSRSAVHGWVHGVYEPNLATLRRIAKALGCDIAKLLGAA